ncbi:hypothetical protein GCM10011386_39200 [Parapedobacter defluvii]|uniref:GIY-YIG domain-containing protein n=1 Tax=Parapedobacter defluvii TaxID=2045106 RepID=A0ABQ1MR47_9SPHI|nr:hypothetical protein [Parapedobacter defluvii]GGC43088.1 hypothetical protein GCM10011386_39200 [Parapedobacter defluvii]
MMFEFLNKYKIHGEYPLGKGQSHSKRCDAPKDGRGVYVVLRGDEVLYISCSGLVRANSDEPKVREADGGGLWGRITGGKLPGVGRQRIHQKLVSENIDEVTIKWWVTYDETYQDNPEDVIDTMKSEYIDNHGRFPKWNNNKQSKLANWIFS